MVFSVPLLDKFHCFSVHRERRFGLLGALLQSVTTFNEGHYSIQVVHRLLKTVQLSERKRKRKSLRHFEYDYFLKLSTTINITRT